MADTTKIEWTDATWNIINGCSVHTPGCTNCYAMLLAGTRLAGHPSRAGLTTMSKAGPVWTGEVRLYEPWLTQPLEWSKPRDIFVCAHGDLFHEAVTDAMLNQVFAVMAICAAQGRKHRFQILTKRSARMRAFINGFQDQGEGFGEALAYVARKAGLDREGGLAVTDAMTWPLPNVWLGVSTEDQRRADERIPDLLATPAAVRWISAEPLLGAIDLEHVAAPVGEGDDEFEDGDWKLNALLAGSCYEFKGDDGYWYSGDGPEHPALDWVVVGGESGRGARPMHHTWARQLRDQCAAADVPFLFKQWGEWAPICAMSEDLIDSLYMPAPVRDPEASRRCKVDQLVMHNDGETFSLTDMSRQRATGSRLMFQQGYDGMSMYAVGKKRAGRLLDGATHDGMPV